MNKKTIVQGFGAAALIFLLRMWLLLSPRHSLIYHSFLPIHSVIWGVLIDLGVVTLLVALLFQYLQRSKTGVRTVLWVLVGAELAPVVAIDVAAVWQKSLSYRWADLLFYGTLVTGLALRRLRPATFQQVVRGSRFLLLLMGCGMAWTVPELFYLALRPQPHDAKATVLRTGPAIVRGAAPSSHGRIVWLLFDELSYDQTFEHRFAGLAMPNFDKLKSESISFSDLKPAGYDTERVVPSFFLGHVVDEIRSNLDGEPVVRLAGRRDWQPFDARATLFSDAQRLGWATGIVGWYNPYCRILGETLNDCFWRAGNGQWNGTTADQSAVTNAMAPFADKVRSWRRRSDFLQEEKHAADLAALMPQAEALIRDQSVDFAFIHLSIPHPPGIYDRRLGDLRTTGTYIDNLALADRILGELMGFLNTTPSMPRTTVIVCSDHSWRVPLWRPTPQWSQEEESASRGYFDTRPVLMIHFPGQSSEQTVAVPVDDIRIHDMIERMLHGQEPDFAKMRAAGGTLTR